MHGRLLVAALLLGGTVLLGLWARFCEADERERVLRHIVLYRFKPEVTEAQVDDVVAAFAALPDKIDSIIGFERGENVSKEGKADGLTHAFVVTFRDEKGRDEYLAHPAHAEYVEVVRDRREKVVVFDYWADR